MYVRRSHRPPAPPKMGKSKGSVNEDSSWITNPNNPENLERTKKHLAMKATTRAFVESMRCSIEEAECQTSKEERIDCIDFGKLLEALDKLNDCMNTYGMTRTTADLDHHLKNAKILHMATPPESRDYLSYLLQSSGSNRDASNKSNGKKNEGNFNMPFVRAFSIAGSQDEPMPEPAYFGRAQSCHPELLATSTAAAMSKDTLTTIEKPKPIDEVCPCLLNALDRKKARNSMFWLCYFVRYLYNVHRLVLQIGHNVVDASPMAFMRYLYTYFEEYYAETKDAKAYLKLLTDYQSEHFLGDATSGGTKGIDQQALMDLKTFLGVIEVVMYLWTPAFQEMALQ
eukprot:CAMPEP_0116133948 /NCGR_PEP_ID=MMETSP0329-20121206/10386_1 /TAXON_ID=697910 /ORGANISM="Pseudo-nitzschia arenysensis, Strain B593" /LENGTH=340 /DNA_ID=CAMNT_0003628629 /DNA_START=143 /DNA_END=1165 /DNA_ORIENTATION=+